MRIDSRSIMRYKIVFRRLERADIVVLNLHLSPFVEECVKGLNYSTIDLQKPRIFLNLRFLWKIVRALPQTSKLAAWVVAFTYASNASVLLTMDNFDNSNHQPGQASLLEEVSKVLKSCRIFSIQHGQELRRMPTNRDRKDVTLLCWGDWARENFPKFGRNEARLVPVGALVNDLYLRIRPDVSIKHHVLFVSTVKDESWWGQSIGERREGYELLASYLRRFCEKFELRPTIALTIDRDHNPDLREDELEREWFESRFSGNVEFSHPGSLFGRSGDGEQGDRAPKYRKERYATYFASDCSRITIGMSSTVLWESFARGNRILSVNLTSNESFDFPIHGTWSLSKPSYEEFERRVRDIIEMTDEDWNRVSLGPRRFLVRQEVGKTSIDLIRAEIMREIKI